MLINDDFRTYEQRMMRRIRAGDEYKDMAAKLKKSKKGVFAEEIKNKFGTIYTPDFVVEKTCELAFKYVPAGTDLLSLTYCDPAAGDGGFLLYIYKKLMDGSKDIKKSEHILTKCLFGIEILKQMHLACKLRLLNEHLKLGGDLRIFDELNIHWGNTICIPKDTEQEWYKNRKDYEGGLLDEEIRNKHYDCLLSNPPYTHLRGIENRIYQAYPKQRDMAQVFVRWSLDHITEKGIISYNTINTWLNTKISDGAIETRKLVNGKIREVILDEEIMRYSEDIDGVGGGEISTFIFSINQEMKRDIIINKITYNYNQTQILTPGFLSSLLPKQKVSFYEIPLHNYAEKMTGVLGGKKGTKTKEWSEFLYKEFSLNGDFYLICKECLYEHTYRGSWKIIKTNDPNKTLEDYESWIKYMKVDYSLALWLCAYLNTTIAKQLAEQFTKPGAKHGGWCGRLSTNLTLKSKLCRVPDYDFYLKDRPERTQQYMVWIEQNMKDKDVFLAGIDEQFGKLVK
jgi:hypothetical protein